jgi:hypothetical protein
MASTEHPLRIVQWTTGKVARESIKAILDRPFLQLIGVYAHSKEKAGQDVGDLAQLGRKLGIAATSDIDALIALKPDCVVYMPLHPNVEHLARLLRAGINIASTASFMTGRGYGEQARKTLEEAAQAGKSSLFGSGINPGWIDNLTAAASSLCREVNQVRIVESFNIGLWAGDANQDALGWGRPAGDPTHAKDVEQATLPFGDAVEAIAALFKFELDDVRCEVEFAHATEDLDVPGRTVKKGSVAGIMAKWFGIASGLPVIEATVQWCVGDEITPAWEISMAYRIEVNGTPQIKMRVEVLPDDLSLPVEELMTIGFMFPATPVVNAIPAVIAARPGIVTYADLPPMTSILRPKALKNQPSTPLVEAPAPIQARRESSDTAVTVEGKWNVTVRGPTGPQATELFIERVGGKLTGVQAGQGMSSPIVDVTLDGTRLRWINHVTKPMKLKVEFTGEIDGNTMAGKCKAGFMGSYKFSATKA